MSIVELLAIATIVESVWETIKMVGKNGKFNWDRVGALVVGVLIAFGTGTDIFQLLEIPFKIPYLGSFLTGLLMSRGANFIHELFKALNLGSEILAARKSSQQIK